MASFVTRMAAFVLAVVAVLAVFIEIPIISNYAFWVLVVAYLLYVARFRPLSMGLEEFTSACTWAM